MPLFAAQRPVFSLGRAIIVPVCSFSQQDGPCQSP
jgi:hypothetical protein